MREETKDRIAFSVLNVMFLLLISSLLALAYVLAWTLVACPPAC